MKSTLKRAYIPALKHHWLTRFYDLLIEQGMQEKKMKMQLVHQASLQSGQSVMDLACGTGTLALMLQQSQPGVHVIGLDADSKILSIAKKKMQENRADSIHFVEGFSVQIPFSDNRFHHVFTSLFIHHLTMKKKLESFKEVRRVLKPGGQLHVLDFEKPQNVLMRAAFLPVQFLDGFETTSPYVQGIIPDLLKKTGFAAIEETRQFPTIVGTLRAYKAYKP